MEIEGDELALLMWLDEQTPEDGHTVDQLLVRFADLRHLPFFWDSRALARALSEKGYAVFNARGVAESKLLITPQGRQKAHDVRAARRDHVRRTHHANDVIIRWLFLNHRGSFGYISDFVGTPEACFLAEPMNEDELNGAAHYLEERKLIASGEAGGWRLTADGIDCAISGGIVSDYRARQGAVGPTIYSVHNAQGSIIGGQHQSVTQTNAFGFNPGEAGQLLQLAMLIRQIGPTLDLPEAEQAELMDRANVLEIEAGSGSPDPGRLRRAADRVVGALGSATNLTAGLALLVEQGHKAYSAVFGN